MNRDFRFKILYPIIGGITGIIFIWMLSYMDVVVGQIENFILDIKYVFSARDVEEQELKEGVTKVDREIESDIMILEIDEKSVGMTDVLGKFPWPRSVYGEIINYFDVDQELIENYNEEITKANQTLSELRDKRKEASDEWNNLKFKLISEINNKALEYTKDNDITLYNELHSANLRIISRLSMDSNNKTILDEITMINEFVLKELEPNNEDKLEYYQKIKQWVKNLETSIIWMIENNQDKLTQIDEEDEDSEKSIEEITTQIETLEQQLEIVKQFNNIIDKYINYINPEEFIDTDELIIDLKDYINNTLGIELEEDNEKIDDENLTNTDTDTTEKPTDKQLIKNYLNLIIEKEAKFLQGLNKSSLKSYTDVINKKTINEEDSTKEQNMYNELSISNTNIINVLFRNEDNIEILSNTERVTTYILKEMKPLNRNQDRYKYYDALINLSKLLRKYINESNIDNSIIEILENLEKNAEILSIYYQKRFIRDDILNWNLTGVESVLGYNNGQIAPDAFFFDIFIDQPGETNIYELSSKKSFYDILKNDINQEEGFINYSYNDFTQTVEDVRGISDQRLFDELKEQKEEGDNFVFWDYFGQYIEEGRLGVTDIVARLKAMEPYKVTENITNPEVGSRNIFFYRDIKPPLVPVINNSAGIGAAMVEPDYDGTLRKMPLIIRYYDERKDPTQKDKPIMEKPEYYAAINLVLAMDYYKVKKEDVVITLGDKCVLKNATIPNKIKITHEYFDEVLFTKTQREYYFNNDDIRRYFENQTEFPEFTTVSIIHYEEQKLVEDGETTLSDILKNIENSKDEITKISFSDGNENITIDNLKDKYIVSEYGIIKFNGSQLEDRIISLFGDKNLQNVNVKFSHWENANQNNNNNQNHANKVLVEDGSTSLINLIKQSTNRIFAGRGITFTDMEKGPIQIYDLENTLVEIPRRNDDVLKMTATELSNFLNSTVTIRKIEEDNDTDEEDFRPIIIPLHEFLLKEDFTKISYNNEDDQIRTIDNLNELNITIQLETTENFRFKANRFSDIYFQETEIRDVIIPIDKEGKFIINFQGNPGTTFESRPIYQLYSEITNDKGDSGRDNWDTYKNRVLLGGIYSSAGINTEGRKDTFQTPYGNMFGIEVHANSLYSIFNEDFITTIPDWVDWLIIIGILLLLVLILPRISILKGAIIGVFLILMIFVEGITFFVLFKINIPIFPQLVTAFYGFIALTVIKLLSEEREKRQIRGVFSTYVNVEVVNELLKDPEHALQLGGASKIITCFFSDIRGFTSLSEELKKVSDTELVNRMNEYFSVMTDIILKYKGTLDKYMGDAIMAFWGAPIEYDKHTLLACKTALEMIEQLPKLKAEWPENLRNFDIGIGINTGPAVAGNTGSELRKNYTILGDTVNLGSRLEGVNKTYKTRIIISEYTKKEVEDFVIIRELDLIRVKGKTEPVRIYELLGLNEAGENYQIGDVKININK